MLYYFELYMHHDTCFRCKQLSYAACDAALAKSKVNVSEDVRSRVVPHEVWLGEVSYIFKYSIQFNFVLFFIDSSDPRLIQAFQNFWQHQIRRRRQCNNRHKCLRTRRGRRRCGFILACRRCTKKCRRFCGYVRKWRRFHCNRWRCNRSRCGRWQSRI